jgi:hypothetical protein
MKRGKHGRSRNSSRKLSLNLPDLDQARILSPVRPHGRITPYSWSASGETGGRMATRREATPRDSIRRTDPHGSLLTLTPMADRGGRPTIGADVRKWETYMALRWQLAAGWYPACSGFIPRGAR